MLFTYDGIVVGRREIGDNSYFLDILTDEQGIVEATAHGAKKLNSSIQSSSELFAYATFCLNKTNLRYSVNSARPKFSFHEVGKDIVKLALASYFAQVIRSCTPQEQEQHESIVRFLAIALYEIRSAVEHIPTAIRQALPETAAPTGNGRTLETVRAAFELRFACMMGYRPDLRACANCGCYEPSENKSMFFLPDRGELFCEDCFDGEYGGESEKLLPDTLSAMRNIVYAPTERCFKFTLNTTAQAQLSFVSERYLLRRTEHGFNALSYYKSLL